MFPSVFKSYDEHGLHVYSSVTDAMLEKNPIVLPVGTHARISLQAVKTNRLRADQLGRPLCTEKSLKYFTNYSYAGCQVECLIDSLLEQCNCVGISTYCCIPRSSVCNPKEAFKCYDKLAYNFTSMLTKCRLEHCGQACTYWRYTVSLTSGQVFIPKLEEEMLNYWRLPAGDTKTSLIIADVYFSDIEYTDIVQVPAMTIESFVSSIGGAMGLWTGASIVTWVHLLYFCLTSIFNRERTQKPVTNSEGDPEDPTDPAQPTNRKRAKKNSYGSASKPKKVVTKIKLDKAISVSIETDEYGQEEEKRRKLLPPIGWFGRSQSEIREKAGATEDSDESID